MDATGSMIELIGVSKAFDGAPAVQELSLDIAHGEVAVLVGPSGCGKSTTLRMINRLVEPTGGTIRVEGRDITSVDAVTLRRSIGYVIQQIGLFPHQRVLANVMTVPLMLGTSKAESKRRAEQLLELVGLDPAQFGRRYPHQLSGGQQQRVGVARALAARPPVLLMDEPFGAIDPLERHRLQLEFSQLQRQLGTTVVLVTHDIDEAVRLGDRVAVMAPGGRLAQWGTPAEVLGHPADDYVDSFVGSSAGLRRLSVTKIDPALLEPASGDLGTTVPHTATLEEALTALLAVDGAGVAVADGDRVLGRLTLESIQRTLRTV
jgi:osmoprotectant transport system ATP-binding protein